MGAFQLSAVSPFIRIVRGAYPSEPRAETIKLPGDLLSSGRDRRFPMPVPHHLSVRGRCQPSPSLSDWTSSQLSLNNDLFFRS
jgi:hypothetical protein